MSEIEKYLTRDEVVNKEIKKMDRKLKIVICDWKDHMYERLGRKAEELYGMLLTDEDPEVKNKALDALMYIEYRKRPVIAEVFFAGGPKYNPWAYTYPQFYSSFFPITQVHSWQYEQYYKIGTSYKELYNNYTSPLSEYRSLNSSYYNLLYSLFLGHIVPESE